MDRFTTIAAELIRNKIAELSDQKFLDRIDLELIFKKAAEMPLKPANDRMSDDDARELISRGTWITNTAGELISAHMDG